MHFRAAPSCLAREARLIMAYPGAAGSSPTLQPTRFHSVNVNFQAAETRQAQKITRCMVYAVAPARMELLTCSDFTIAFHRTNHPTYAPHPGKFALVVDPIVEVFQIPCVLMDGTIIPPPHRVMRCHACGCPFSRSQ